MPTDQPDDSDTPTTDPSEPKESFAKRLGSLEPAAQQVLLSAVTGSMSILLSVFGIFAEDLTGTRLHLLQGVAGFLAVGTVLALFAPLVRNWKRFTVLILTIACVPALVAVFLPQIRDVLNPNCDDPIELTVAVPSEGAAGFADVVEAFADGQLDEDRCRMVSATAIPISRTQARNDFADDWGNGIVDALGSRPDVWIAESAAHIDIARSLLEDEAPLGGKSTPIGYTPLVLAVPSDSDTSAATAEDAFTALAEKGLVVRSDPALSLTGLYHLDWLYKLDLSDSTVEQMIDDGLAQLGVGATDDAELLCGLFGSDDDPTAVLTTERAMAVYNKDLMGSDCPRSDPPAEELTALYPDHAGKLDYSAQTLEWSGSTTADHEVESERDQIADDFVEWLTGPRGQVQLDGIGIRTEVENEAILELNVGVDRGAAENSLGPDSELLAELLSAYEAARAPTRVLLAVDNSGSMDETAGPTGETLADIAVTGADQALDSFGADDELGLWAFPDGDRLEWVELMPIAAATAENHEKAVGRLSGLDPAGDTPLYHTIAEGVSTLEQSVGEDEGPAVKPVMVLLTDGIDDDGAHEIDIDELTAQVQPAGVQLYVITVGSVTCESTGLDELTEATRGHCDSVQAQSLEAAFQDVFDQVWGGDA